MGLGGNGERNYTTFEGTCTASWPYSSAYARYKSINSNDTSPVATLTGYPYSTFNRLHKYTKLDFPFVQRHVQYRHFL